MSNSEASVGLIGLGITYTLFVLVKFVPIILGVIVGMSLADIIGLNTFWSYWGFVYIFTLGSVAIINIDNRPIDGI